jgi:hypothetical protein
MVAIAVTMLTLFQASVVPYWNKQVEATEIKVTYDDMMFLPSDIDDVAIHETPKTCTVQLGAQYPDRMIFRNPGPGAFGTLTVEEVPAQVTVRYNDGTNHTKPYNSARITYEMSGTINSPKLVYEHGVIITDWWTVSLTTDKQKLIANDNIYIPILNGSSSSKSAIGVESIAIKPYEYLDTLGDIDTVSVTLYTDYRELWESTLLSPSVVENLSFSGTVDFGSNKIYINTSVPYLKLPNQTASRPLHAGMISCTVEDPDVGGGGGGDGGCGAAPDFVEEDTSHINITGGKHGADEIVNLNLANEGNRTVAIDYVRVSWTGTGGTLDYILIDSTKVSGTSGLAVSSGMWVGLTEAPQPQAKDELPKRLIEPDEEIIIDFEFQNNDDMANRHFTIDLLFNDGSVLTFEFDT